MKCRWWRRVRRWLCRVLNCRAHNCNDNQDGITVDFLIGPIVNKEN